ncbi:unnamed protein product [Bursaphelenchus xylophilus]|uniref:(pine wood nematode) hypothetical protein n=1 Tax=Bursaphelenchus xylophilus TaxID=6326 RepID=A0A1I7RQH9_BURXY|nr:unnamed protein product [Bursaphelenchus xylophilus]CAG9104608.1 unnamed protein product [Bursaphelenchus xylophilus]
MKAYDVQNSNVYGDMILIWTPIFPLLCSGFGIAALVSGYLIAVLNDHEEAWLPLISEGGSIAPESCVFGTLLNLAAFFWWITCFCVHFQLIQHIQIYRSRRSKLRFLFMFMLIAGLFSGLGLILVGNFQLSTVRAVHGKGATGGFFGGMVYAWSYVVLLMLLRPRWIPKWLLAVRVLMVTIVSCAVILHEVSMRAPVFVARREDGSLPPKPDTPENGILRLKPSDPYYNNRIIACIAEWTLGIGYFLIIATIAMDLRWFRIDTHDESVAKKDGGKIVPIMVDEDRGSVEQFKF